MEKRKDIIFIIIACISIIIFSIAICPVQLQNDTFYTIKIGEFISQNGIDGIKAGLDPFSWHESLPYTFPHWAYDFIIYNIFNLSGFLGIQISTIILACILGLSIFGVNAKITKNKLTSFVITIGAMYLIRNYIAARAQLVTFILFIWTIYFIEKYLETSKKKYGIGLIIISILIANIHSAVWPFFFVLFLPYIAEYIISNFSIAKNWYIKRLKRKLKKSKNKEELQEKISRLENHKKEPYKIIVEKNKNVKWLILIMVICAFTGLLTPIGDMPYTYVIKIAQGNTTKIISEHLPLTLVDFHEFAVLLVIFFAILIFTDSKIKLRDLFMFSGLLVLAFITRRQISMFVLICSLVFNRLVCDLFDKYDSNGTKQMIKYITTLLGSIITIGIILIISCSIVKPKLSQKYISEKNYPVKAVDYITENIDISNMHIYNGYDYGSYLIYRGIPVFIDSRSDLYTPQFNNGKDIFSDLINISGIATYYEDKFEDYGITHLLIKKNSKLNLLISRDDKYDLLYSDDYFCLYKRN